MNDPTRRILVVEDEPVINGAVIDRLAAAGYDVVRAWDGPGAVVEFTIHHPDVVILDVMLSRLRRARGLPAHPGRPAGAGVTPLAR